MDDTILRDGQVIQRVESEHVSWWIGCQIGQRFVSQIVAYSEPGQAAYVPALKMLDSAGRVIARTIVAPGMLICYKSGSAATGSERVPIELLTAAHLDLPVADNLACTLPGMEPRRDSLFPRDALASHLLAFLNHHSRPSDRRVDVTVHACENTPQGVESIGKVTLNLRISVTA